MSLREDMWKYEQITGESAEHIPIIKLGAFLDGYEMGLKALEQQICKDMRDATEKERKSTKDYIDSISKPTGLRFDDLYEEIDFVQPHRKIPCTITIGKPSEDCISRAEALRIAESYYHTEQVVEEIRELPSVTPQPKIGHWIEYPNEWGDNWQYSKYECSVCHCLKPFHGDFCPNCGAKMEVKENDE